MPVRPVLTCVAALACAAPATADNAGSYLAARSAIISNDYAEAADYYARALVGDSANPELLENGLTAFLGMGDIDRASELGRRMIQLGQNSQIAGLVVLGDRAADENWDVILADLAAGQTVGPLFDGLLAAWAEVGAGRMSDAMAAAFSNPAQRDALVAFLQRVAQGAEILDLPTLLAGARLRKQFEQLYFDSPS